ncbi:MAG TPA: excinuclease ABC subunit UvrC [Saprospiraceae bacterium]|nr:excinuclease ABC subunit UvrC [Saprospiraceae bacterium]HNE64379.1 excinuclease ABC subunit UvrC [Saprospiraceae bacterium]HNJ62056.1 excinuclease ABC subunit UvrC [Saprospiraceae bacterium]HNL93501.1 excinuclease ABC subunit UvrC [Saprospiraceae bacterium]
MTQDDFRNISSTLPSDPGIYKYFNEEDTILYVGKAKNLKKRLASYFVSSKNLPYKTRLMLRHATRIEYTITKSESDALLLENSLIKKFQPRYNVMLKDAKSYSYICISNEHFPKVFFTRRIIRNGSLYFGPYTSKFRVNILLDLIKSLFPLRNCNLQLTPDNIAKRKFNVCLEYHIKNCEGPCIGAESEEHYNKKIEQIKNILKGHLKIVKDYLLDEMNRCATNLDFEKAQQMKDKLIAFEDYQAKSTVVNINIRDVDVFYIESNDTTAFVNYLKIIDGSIVNTHTLELIKNLDDDDNDLLSYSIDVLREKFNSIAPEIIVPFEPIVSDTSLLVTIPKVGDKKKLLEMAEKNVKYFILQQQQAAINSLRKLPATERILKTLQADLRMSAMPLHIECFDNSNIQGTNPVASCVVYKNAKPSKADYRHFKIKTVVGPDDFASMYEIVTRRYARMLAENKTLPQLVVIDGGKGQLSSAVSALKDLGILEKFTVIGIAKKLEEIFFPEDSIPLYINKKSESLKLIQQIRNEAHRFAITFHRDQRSKNFTKTVLTDIQGVGPKTAEKLLKHFGSFKKIMDASDEELKTVAGVNVARLIKEYYTAEDVAEDKDEVTNED